MLISNEEEQAEQAKADPQAFGRLYDQYYGPVFGFLAKRTGNAEAAKDLASETFFQALKNIHRFQSRGAKSFKCWLYAIAVAQIGNYFRARGKYLPMTSEEFPDVAANETYDADAPSLAVEEANDVQAEVARLKTAMKKLNPKQRNVLELRYTSGFAIAEIAATLGMKEGTVKSHIHRAQQKLRVLLEGKKESYATEPATQFGRAAHAART